MSLASEVLHTPSQSVSDLLQGQIDLLRNKIAQHFGTVAQHFQNQMCCGSSHGYRWGNSGAQQCNTSISYFYQKREKRMEQERKTHVYRGEFMGAVQSVVPPSEAGR